MHVVENAVQYLLHAYRPKDVQPTFSLPAQRTIDCIQARRHLRHPQANVPRKIVCIPSPGSELEIVAADGHSARCAGSSTFRRRIGRTWDEQAIVFKENGLPHCQTPNRYH
jgi:hypothetical protein